MDEIKKLYCLRLSDTRVAFLNFVRTNVFANVCVSFVLFVSPVRPL